MTSDATGTENTGSEITWPHINKRVHLTQDCECLQGRYSYLLFVPQGNTFELQVEVKVKTPFRGFALNPWGFRLLLFPLFKNNFFIKRFLKMYLFDCSSLNCGMQNLHCGMWNLVPWPGNPGPLHCQHSLNCWATSKVPLLSHFIP